VKVNGRALEAVADPGSYVAIRRVWKDGDTIGVSLPMELRTELLAGDDTVAAVMYGPLLLAADLGAGPVDGPSKVIHDGSTVPKGLPKPDALPKVAADAGDMAWLKTEPGDGMRFQAAAEGGSLELLPMYQVKDQRYSVYWQMREGKKPALTS